MSASLSPLNSTVIDIPLQNASIDIWETKYRLKTKDGSAVDKDIDATYQRVAKALAAVEKTEDLQKKYYQEFLWVLRQGAIPAGRIISNAGAKKHKPATSTINCFAYETPVLTDKGVFPIGELANNKKAVKVLNGNGNWSSVMFESHGKQAVHTLAFKYADNKAISKVRATKNHRWILKSGSVITSEFWLTTSKLKSFREIAHITATINIDNHTLSSKLWTFVNISDSVEMEEVYCCTEPETGSFCLFHGLLTGNCTVSGIIEDSMDDILDKVHEAGLTLKAGCVAPNTLVVTEKGYVTAKQAVTEKHQQILSYDKKFSHFEMRPILEHLTTHVPQHENIEIESHLGTLTTSIKHPVLVYRHDKLQYVRADEINTTDALIHHQLKAKADNKNRLKAWFTGAHLGDGSAYEQKFSYADSRKKWQQKALLKGKRLVFKIRAAEREVVERYALFFERFYNCHAKVVSTVTPNNTPVWDFTVASFKASAASELIDGQIGKKTTTLKVPKWIKQNPECYFLPFLAGLIDTDGTINTETGSAILSCQNKDFIYDIQSLLALFGIHGGITHRKPRSHIYNNHVINDVGGYSLKISDSNFLIILASFMADSGKKQRIEKYQTTAGQYDSYVISDALRQALIKYSESLSHLEKQTLGFYHGKHKQLTVSRVYLDRWDKRFPELHNQINFVKTLRPVKNIKRNLDISETFYDFTVDTHNNYLAGNNALIVLHNCGIGYEFSTLRPKNAYVSGAGAYTSGPLSFMDIYDKMCFTVSSAGGRRGAQMATFDICHPDVIEFIRAKREDGRLRQFNLSLLITSEFIEAVKNKSDWPLSFPVTEKEVKQDNLNLNDITQIIWRDLPETAQYVNNTDGLVACRIIKTIPAQRLWDIIMSSTYDYAEPGFILIDKVNEMNNNWFCENIRATNPSLAKGTLVHTKAGIIPIQALEGQNFLVRALDGSWGNAKCWKSSDSATTKVLKFGMGQNVTATLEHKWPVLDKLTGRIQRTLTSQLKVGDEIPKNLVASLEIQGDMSLTETEGFFLGLWLADGHLSKTASGHNLGMTFNRLDRDLAEKSVSYLNSLKSTPSSICEREDSLVIQVSSKKTIDKLIERLGIHSGDRYFPAVIWTSNDAFIRGFVDGFVSGDGYVCGNGKQRIIIRQKSQDVMVNFAKLLSFMGITGSLRYSERPCTFPNEKDYGRKYSTWDYCLGKIASVKFSRIFSLTCERKQDALLEIASSQVNKGIERNLYQKIIAIEDGNQSEAVWDIAVEHPQHLFPIEWSYTGNCGEQALPPYGSCWTGSMRLNTNFGYITTKDAYDLSQEGNLKIAVDSLFTGENKTVLRDCRITVMGQREVFKLYYKNGQEIELTADHQVWTNYGWKKVKDLHTGHICYSQGNELELPNEMQIIDDFNRGKLNYILDFHKNTQNTKYEITKTSHVAYLRLLLPTLGISYNIIRRKCLVFSKFHTIVEYCLSTSLETYDYKLGYLYSAYQFPKKFCGRKSSLVGYGSKLICDKLLKYQQELFNFTSYPSKQHNTNESTFRVKLFPQINTEIIENSLLKQRESVLIKDTERLNFYGLLGWMLADGWLSYHKKKPSCGFSYNTEDDGACTILVPLFENICNRKGKIYALKCLSTYVYTVRSDKRSIVDKFHKIMQLNSYKSADIIVPDYIFKGSLLEQSHFISAVFGADGCFSKNKTLSLTSKSKKWLQDIQLLLLNFGVHSTIKFNTKDSGTYGLYIKNRDHYKFYAHIGFKYNTQKHAKLKHKVNNQLIHNRRDSVAHLVIDKIESIGEHTVYDIEEPSTNTLIVNGIVVHNCLLGSINLTRFVENPFTEKAAFDWITYRKAIRIFTRMLDNVVEINGLPLEKQRVEIISKRRHGMGYLGLGSTVTMLGMKYGDEKSLSFTDEVTKVLAVEGWKEGLALAKEKGVAPILEKIFSVTPEILHKRPEMVDDGYKLGDKIAGKVLHAKYSRYMQQIAQEEPELVAELIETGARFTHATSLAPTGTISLSLANNASNGIEPSFAHHYSRNVIREGKKSKEKVDVYSFELLAYRELINPEAMPDSENPAQQLPDYFISADNVSPKQHVDVQAAAQKWIDSSISKTANVPTDYPYEDFKNIYQYAYEKGLKGCTTFRFNPEVFQGVLVKEADLENTTYEFTLEDGSKVELKGNEEVEYDGEMHSAANLFDALKEGYYGKF